MSGSKRPAKKAAKKVAKKRATKKRSKKGDSPEISNLVVEQDSWLSLQTNVAYKQWNRATASIQAVSAGLGDVYALIAEGASVHEIYSAIASNIDDSAILHISELDGSSTALVHSIAMAFRRVGP